MGVPFPGVDPLYWDLVIAINTAQLGANGSATANIQRRSTPGQIAAVRLEMQKSLDKKESEPEMKDTQLETAQQKYKMKYEQLNNLQHKYNLKDEKLNQKDNRIKVCNVSSFLDLLL
jgi:flagellar capping protein FliD